jgi:DNA-binding winged helix-turn-helix (wHTH) protein
VVRIRFGPFVLDLETRQLTEEDREIRLSPKAFELLLALVADRPKVMSKTVLQGRLWPETFVAEANLSNLVGEIRGALGDPPRAPRFIRTAHGFGYAFVADATVQHRSAEASVDQPRCWIEWSQRRFPMSAGTHIVGRDPDVELRLEHSTVSRRHARFIVTASGTTLEDVASKNGTFRAGERVTSPVLLADGEAIRIGSLLLTFRMRAPCGLTDTQTVEATAQAS